MPPSITKAQIRKLGERLCAEVPRQEDLDALATLQDDYLTALEAVDHALREILGLASGQLHDGVEITLSNRLKRDRRIIEKLRRGTELDRMQDIVGFRIVGDLSLSQQDDLTNEVAKHFDGVVKDRRSAPSYGYRAVHVVASTDGFLVEVQIQTILQDGWAQGMESLSDDWGRAIQYGGPPEALRPDVLEARTKAVEALKAISPLMAELEELEDDVRRDTRELAEIEESESSADQERGRALEDHREEARVGVEERVGRIRVAIEDYQALLEGESRLAE